jgi:hypothetical protein
MVAQIQGQRRQEPAKLLGEEPETNMSLLAESETRLVVLCYFQGELLLSQA